MLDYHYLFKGPTKNTYSDDPDYIALQQAKEAIKKDQEVVDRKVEKPIENPAVKKQPQDVPALEKKKTLILVDNKNQRENPYARKYLAPNNKPN